jgi:hypothetical protein
MRPITSRLSALLALTASAALLSSCASTGNISPQYIPPSNYQSYNCSALGQEYNRINTYVKQAQQQQSTLSTTGVGVGVSAGRWGISPNISFGLGKSGNTQARDAKLSRLYGERDAVVQSARLKQCDFATGLKIYGE